MSKIVIDARKLRSSTGRYHRELLNHLESIDTINEYYVLAHKEDLDTAQTHHWAPKSKNFHAVECNIPHYSFSEQLGLRTVLKSLNPDLVHFLMPQQPAVYRGKKITTVHDLNYVHLRIYNGNRVIYELKRFVFKFLLKRISKTNDAIITPTTYTKNDLVDYTNVKPEKVFPIHEGVAELSSKDKVVTKLKNKSFLLYVGQSSKYKGQLNLIKSLDKLHKNYPELRLAIVGKPNSYTDTLKKYVKQNNIKNVHFLGFISDEELAWLYKNAAAYVQPSTNEGFGLMNLEAMQYGAPVVSSNATCLLEVCEDAAHYFDPTNIDDMTRAISEVISDDTLRKKLIALGNKQHKKYSWKKMAEETHAVYERVLKS